jgi:hypothetical protein
MISNKTELNIIQIKNMKANKKKRIKAKVINNKEENYKFQKENQSLDLKINKLRKICSNKIINKIFYINCWKILKNNPFYYKIK